MSEKVVQDIVATRVHLFEMGWVKGNYYKEGKNCLVGAIMVVTNDEALARFSVCYWVAQAINQEFPHRAFKESPHVVCVNFNDHPVTCFDDVVRVLDVAEKLASK